MRVLIVSQYFSPEITAAPRRLAPLAAGLAARGHDVTVVSQLPSHPRGEIYPGFRNVPRQRREVDGYRVEYVWAYTDPTRKRLRRVGSYLSYATTATLFGAIGKEPDVVLASSPPLSAAAVGAVLAARYRVPWVMDVRDLWPQVAEALDQVKSRRLMGIARKVERHLYASAAAIQVATAPFAEYIAGVTGESGKVHLLENGTTEDWLQMGEEEVDRHELGLPVDDFLWTYAGNVGLSQSLDAAVDAAELLGSGYQLLIMGDGASRGRLERRAEECASGQVQFRDSVPPQLAARIMRASDALLVSLANKTELGRTIPIKLYDSCALGRPVIVSAPGESARIATQTGAALAIEPESPAALAGAVERLRQDSVLSSSLSASAKAFASERLRGKGVEKLEKLLGQVAGDRDD